MTSRKEDRFPPNTAWQVDTAKTDFSTDALRKSRQPFATLLTSFVERVDTPFVLCLHGAWGTGKTTFIRMWKTHLEETLKFPSVYFSAWEHEWHEQPFTALLHAIAQRNSDQEAKGATEKLKGAGKALMATSPKVLNLLLKAAIHIDVTEIEECIGTVAEQFANGALAEQREGKGNPIFEFRQALSNYISAIRKAEGAPEEAPLVVIIDELDRCRPDFSIRVLEQMKHVFNTDRILFVLVLNREELAHAIQKIHGCSDGTRYLRRFIDIEFTLPPCDLWCYTEWLFERLPRAGPANTMREESLRALFMNTCKGLDLGLREIQRVLQQSLVALTLSGKTVDLDAFLISFLTAFSCRYPQLVSRFLDGQVQFDQLRETLRTHGFPGRPWHGEEFITLEAFLRIADGNRQRIDSEMEDLKSAAGRDADAASRDGDVAALMKAHLASFGRRGLLLRLKTIFSFAGQVS